ncbi:hypothetical protein EDB83DRAFT_2193757, partial [Lactarius deliciosus]
CSITSLGTFDPKKGGHIILWDFKMVMEFPASSTVLISSALITHSNTPIRPGEKQFCITQFVAGGLL